MILTTFGFFGYGGNNPWEYKVNVFVYSILNILIKWEYMNFINNKLLKYTLLLFLYGEKHGRWVWLPPCFKC